jgi:hypothetical protein
MASPASGTTVTLQTTVIGPGVLSFSSGFGYASYGFQVDGVTVFQFIGEWVFTPHAIDIPSGSHTLAWVCSYFPSPGDLPPAALLDNVAFSPTAEYPLAAALDDNNLIFLTGGYAPWFRQTTNTHDGFDAAQSCPISDGQESWMQTRVTGPGTLAFWWKVSSQLSHDYLEYYLDDVLQGSSRSGAGGWLKKTSSISNGTHTAKWRYVKDGATSSGSDAGWVDEVSFLPAPAIVTTNGSLAVVNGQFGFTVAGVTGQTVIIDVSTNLAVWTPLQTNTLTGATFNFSVPQSLAAGAFLFRARQGP